MPKMACTRVSCMCKLSGNISVNPKHKAMYFMNQSGADGFDENWEKRLQLWALKDNVLHMVVVEVTIKSVRSSAAAPQCTEKHCIPVIMFSIARYMDNFFREKTYALIQLFLMMMHLKDEASMGAEVHTGTGHNAPSMSIKTSRNALHLSRPGTTSYRRRGEARSPSCLYAL